MPTKQRERARSPGKSPRMPVGQSIEPPKDLWELRRICPGMKWGSNVPPPVRAAEAGDDGDAVSPRRFESGLPTAYLMATRGDIRESHQPAPVPTLAPRARKASPTKSRRRKTSVPAPAPMFLFGPPKPWNAGPTRWDHGTLAGNSGTFGSPYIAQLGGRRSSSPSHQRPQAKPQRSRSPLAMTAPARPHTAATTPRVAAPQLSHRAATPAARPHVNPKPDKTQSYTYARPRGSPSPATTPKGWKARG
ncbi:hypothetical protein DIPPA_30224 [Diplonema papillatum]|nr:hypothetical protein DIPPA_30224 [Diplonema papillatum]